VRWLAAVAGAAWRLALALAPGCTMPAAGRVVARDHPLAAQSRKMQRAPFCGTSISARHTTSVG
jgi:hypothetical protein